MKNILIILTVLLLFGFGWCVFGYNKAVGLDEGAKTAWANLDSTLQRRLDLVPNLVSVVKGYAIGEKELFENIAKSREKYLQANTVGSMVEASNELDGFLSRLLMLKEAYPDLKANQNFLVLQEQLEGTENRINVARIRYNETAKRVNIYWREFFGTFFCRWADVGKVEYFEASRKAKTEMTQVAI